MYEVMSPYGVAWSHNQMTLHEAQISRDNANRRIVAHGGQPDFYVQRSQTREELDDHASPELQAALPA